MGVKLNALSVDHLETMNETTIKTLATSETIGTLLPTAAFFLRMPFPPARKLIDAGCVIALASDYNPGSSPSGNMSLVIAMACIQMKMLPKEAINAATINGAWALRLADHKGSIEPGKDADLAVFEVEDYREIAYWYGANHCQMTVLNGVIAAHG